MLSQRDKKALLQLYELKGEAILYTSSETTKALPQGTDYVSEGSSRPLAQINAVAKTYSALDGNSVRALDPINFNINDGQFIAVVGPSGCGKSTLLQMMAGAIAPSEGQILRRRIRKGPRPMSVWCSRTGIVAVAQCHPERVVASGVAQTTSLPSSSERRTFSDWH